MALSLFLETQPAFFVLAAALFGLIVGSFLNVVIHRVPIMLSRRWQQECQELAGTDVDSHVGQNPYNLVVPGSCCPHCGHTIRPWENIPLASYLFLRGKCSGCGQRISPRYPLVEILTAAVSAVVAWRLGFGVYAAVIIVLSWALIAMTFIDIDHQLLPDTITLPFLWLGLGINSFHLIPDIELTDAVLGAVAGYLSLWIVYQLFRVITGKEGMGYGDFKLFALFGAWLGWQSLPLIILLAALAGAIVGIGSILLLGRDRQLPIPFGPFLCGAGWIAALWGRDITRTYLQLAGFSA